MVEEIALHIGVHKTASTHLQELIWRNNSLLSEYGIRFYRPVEMRKKVTPNICGVANNNESSKTKLKEAINEIIFQNNFKRIILADENFIGDTRGIYINGSIYPNVVERLKVIRDYLPAEEVKQIYVCFRDYGEYIPSSYCEFIRHNNFVEFGKYVEKFDYSISYWLRLVTEIGDFFPDSSIYVWNYAKYREIEEKISE